jgi:hypothetical protein
MSRHFTSMLLCLLFVHPLAMGAGAPAIPTGKVVCGDPILLHDAFAAVNVDPNAPRATYAALEQALNQRASAWPPEIRTKVVGAYSALLEGKIAPSDYQLVTTGALPPRQFAITTGDFQVDLPLNASDPLCTNPSEKKARKEAAEFVITFSGAFGQLTADQFSKAAMQIGSLEKLYDKYLFEGFPMFPWEAAVNSWFLTDKSISNGPPRDAIVLLHPSAGVVTSVDSDSKSDLGGVLAVEPLGWIHYSADYETWYGVSLLAVFPGDREVGYGVALNYRNFKLGVTYHDDDTGQYDGAAIFFGMDLYQFLGEKQRSYKGYFKQLEEELKKAKP